MPLTGHADTRLILIRGNSGSGKSTLASRIRAARPRGVAIISQDQLRREILQVRDHPGNAAVEYIALSARFALDHGFHTIVEGILYDEIYGDALRSLTTDHHGLTCCYRYGLAFEETLRRHTTRDKSCAFGVEEMRRWWRDSDVLHGVQEKVIGPLETLDESVSRVLRDCGWCDEDPPWSSLIGP